MWITGQVTWSWITWDELMISCNECIGTSTTLRVTSSHTAISQLAGRNVSLGDSSLVCSTQEYFGAPLTLAFIVEISESAENNRFVLSDVAGDSRFHWNSSSNSQDPHIQPTWGRLGVLLYMFMASAWVLAPTYHVDHKWYSSQTCDVLSQTCDVLVLLFNTLSFMNSCSL